MNPKKHNEKTKIIKVLLLDDSPVALVMLNRIISSAPGIQVVGTFTDGNRALKSIPILKPDVICTDLHMPKMDGLEFTKKVMQRFPKPILVVSISVQEVGDSYNIFMVLNAGAVDVFSKPRGGLDSENKVLRDGLIAKIRVLNGVVPFSRKKDTTPATAISKRASVSLKVHTQFKVVSIGASTGGPVALLTILKQLPYDFPLPVICIQHITYGFMDGLVSWLDMQCKIKVKVAQHKDFPEPGVAYFAPEELNLKINDDGRMVYSEDHNVDCLYVPSITTTFRSIAKYYGSAAIGILLTGMGDDGVQGMQSMSEAGALTIAQDEESSIIYGMPKLAIELGVVGHSLSLEEIPNFIISTINRSNHKSQWSSEGTWQQKRKL